MQLLRTDFRSSNLDFMQCVDIVNKILSDKDTFLKLYTKLVVKFSDDESNNCDVERLWECFKARPDVSLLYMTESMKDKVTGEYDVYMSAEEWFDIVYIAGDDLAVNLTNNTDVAHFVLFYLITILHEVAHCCTRLFNNFTNNANSKGSKKQSYLTPEKVDRILCDGISETDCWRGWEMLTFGGVADLENKRLCFTRLINDSAESTREDNCDTKRLSDERALAVYNAILAWKGDVDGVNSDFPPDFLDLHMDNLCSPLSAVLSTACEDFEAVKVRQPTSKGTSKNAFGGEDLPIAPIRRRLHFTKHASVPKA